MYSEWLPWTASEKSLVSFTLPQARRHHKTGVTSGTCTALLEQYPEAGSKVKPWSSSSTPVLNVQSLLLWADGKEVSWAEITSALKQIKTFNVHLPSPPHSASPLNSWTTKQNPIWSSWEGNCMHPGFWVLSSLSPACCWEAWSCDFHPEGPAWFFQSSSHLSSACVSVLYLWGWHGEGWEIWNEEQQGKTATGRAKTLHFSSLLLKSSYYSIISMKGRKEASGLWLKTQFQCSPLSSPQLTYHRTQYSQLTAPAHFCWCYKQLH